MMKMEVNRADPSNVLDW